MVLKINDTFTQKIIFEIKIFSFTRNFKNYQKMSTYKI